MVTFYDSRYFYSLKYFFYFLEIFALESNTITGETLNRNSISYWNRIGTVISIRKELSLRNDHDCQKLIPYTPKSKNIFENIVSIYSVVDYISIA